MLQWIPTSFPSQMGQTSLRVTWIHLILASLWSRQRGQPQHCVLRSSAWGRLLQSKGHHDHRLYQLLRDIRRKCAATG